ncbi:MAG TPA: DMT family transporter [Reyranella sp.]|nr:DMT family transporter [Reyranella sp.]
MLGALCAIGAAAAFSTAGVIVRRVDLPAWDVSFWRSILMLLAVVPLMLWQSRASWIDIRNSGGALFASAAALAGSMIAFILALGAAPVANVLIVYGGITPFLTALLARLFLAEPLHRHTLLAMAAATTGLLLAIGGSLQAGAAGGMALASVVSLCIGANYVIVRRHRAIGMTPALALAGILAALASLPFAHPWTITLGDLPWLLALGPGQLAFGLLLYMAALKRIPAGRAALLGLLEIVLGPIWVWLVDGEQPAVLTLVGGVVVIGSAAANVWLDSRRPTG